MTTKHEARLVELLNQSGSGDLQHFLYILNRAFGEVLPTLVRHVQRYRGAFGDDYDADDVISLGLQDAACLLVAQYQGEDVPFRFAPKFGLDLSGFLLRVIGRPNTGAASRRAGDEYRRALARNSRRAPLDDHAHHLATVDEPEQTALVDFDLEAMLSSLSSREQFVLRAQFGVHEFAALNETALEKLAAQVGFALPEAEAIAQRVISHAKTQTSAKLKVKHLAAALQVGVKQVNTIKRKAIDKLRRTALEPA